ncbi:conserved hypothetical protein [Candida dubliniensis CD36]|uniref:Uncharacterized protein n=1 Tax=Candida dubliniensis (strain CD36 / ATCC MYA-646 / CBS 7987 / NCPF 3949 / NRRL Y-17841) TaxID=573826 RepID=B9WB75_CANDC|nr:conserved hypothetical protein [Candida dubliniensis CD36]CAX43645.1 conserved hypothetical protein [Candida dubliniensis CD36]
MSNNPVLVKQYVQNILSKLQNFLNRCSIPHTTNNILEQNRLFSREGLVSCLEDSIDEIPNHLTTTSTSIDLGTSEFYNSSTIDTSHNENPNQSVSIEQICSMIDEELEIINEHEINNRLESESRGSFLTISKQMNMSGFPTLSRSQPCRGYQSMNQDLWNVKASALFLNNAAVTAKKKKKMIKVVKSKKTTKQRVQTAY